ncbi:hypothetical protein OSB04_029643 [Centaurea solstitialis]|uniref:CCHC-type domain-containing protein n=1 Tax=Centaurea solstitialis TaxID=347529 RepID=A0AA38S628_9ASTR|nr:hypothetical protein OSB04_029643 [Centaurea solstitialis]
MTRRCSHCSNNGHNSRTCPNRGLKLFGVRITDGSIRKSASMGNLTHYTGSGNFLNGFSGGGGAAAGTDVDSPGDTPDHNAAGDGYGSEDFVAGSSSSRERKKGVPWTEEEHRMFTKARERRLAWNSEKLRDLENTDSSREPCPKIFHPQSNMSRRKRRSSLFDIVADDSPDMHMVSSLDYPPGNPSQPEAQSVNNPLTIPTLEEEECESMDSANSNTMDPPIDPTHAPLNLDGPQCLYPVMFPTYVSPLIPVAIPFWPGPGSGQPGQDLTSSVKTESHEVLKPTAVHSKNPINVDDLVGMSKLTLGESTGEGAPSSLKLVGGLNRQSAFHVNNPGPRTDPNHNPIHAV